MLTEYVPTATDEQLKFETVVKSIINEGMPQFQDELFKLTGKYVATEVKDIKDFIRPRLQAAGIAEMGLGDTWAGYNGITSFYRTHLLWMRLLRWIMNNQEKRTIL